MAEVKSWFLCADCCSIAINATYASIGEVNEGPVADIHNSVQGQGPIKVRHHQSGTCFVCGGASDRRIEVDIVSHLMDRIRQVENLSATAVADGDKLNVEISLTENGTKRKASGTYTAPYYKKSGKRAGSINIWEFADLFLDACGIVDTKERSALSHILTQNQVENKLLSKVRSRLVKQIKVLLQDTDVEVLVQSLADKCKDRVVTRKLVETICAKHRFTQEELEEMLKIIRVKTVHN